MQLVSPVGARGFPRDNSVEAKCLATRHATIIGFDKRDNETGVWILTGNLESHERYADVKARHPTKSTAEILQLAGGTYYENCRCQEVKEPQVERLMITLRGGPSNCQSCEERRTSSHARIAFSDGHD